MASQQKVQQRLKERVSLNPEREKRDSEECEKILNDDNLKVKLECIWYCFLGCGDALRNERCDFPHYRKALSPPYGNYVESERHLSMLYRAFDSQHSGEDYIDFISFVRSIFYLGMERYNTQDYEVAFKRMMENHLEGFLSTFRAMHDWKTSTPDAKILEDSDIDNILYVYDGVFERLFNRYKAVDDHEARDLTLDQSMLLDQYVETMELRELAKDYGFFPRHLSWVEISMSAQYSCFGCIVRDPGMMGAAYQSGIQPVKSGEVKALRDSVVSKPIPEPGSPNVSMDAKSSADFEIDRSVNNPLFVEVLPEEFLRDESLLDRPRFMTAMIRLAQALYNRPDFLKRLPTAASRLEEMLAHMAPIYEKTFGRPMDSDCDFTERGIPVLLSSSTTASLNPSSIPMEGNVDVVISGSNFGEKRGVFVRFGPKGKSVLVRCKEVLKRRVTVVAPPAKPQDIEIHLSYLRGQYTIGISRTAKLPVECSNDRTEFSNTDPPQLLAYVQPLPSFTIPESVTSKLLRNFAVLCAHNQPYNSKFLTMPNWQRTKQIYGIAEGAEASPDHAATTPPASPAGAGVDLSADANAPTEVRGADNKNVYFLLHAHLHEGAQGMSLDFKAYLCTLARCFFNTYGEVSWFEHYERIADIEVNRSKTVGRRDSARDLVIDENALINAAIGVVERRSVREVDVYLGPVLCGHLREQPGNLDSQATGLPVTHFRNHPALTYHHLDDFNSEKIAISFVINSRTFESAVDRFIQNGFDIACHDPDVRTRKPVGRAWAVSEGGKQVATVWDYPGHLSPMEWQPAAQALRHDTTSVGVYAPAASEAFRKIFQAFTKGTLKGAGDLRERLAVKGFAVTTKLYRLPI